MVYGKCLKDFFLHLSFPEGSSSYADSEEEDGSDRQRGTMIEDDGIGNSSAALVSRIEKQRVVSL